MTHKEQIRCLADGLSAEETERLINLTDTRLAHGEDDDVIAASAALTAMSKEARLALISQVCSLMADRNVAMSRALQEELLKVLPEELDHGVDTEDLLGDIANEVRLKHVGCY